MDDANKDKKIDESWKDRADREKKVEPEQPAEKEFQMTFPIFVSSLGMQALVALGEMENPVTKKKETDLSQARYLIDTIEMLQEKTKGNIAKQEVQMLEDMLYQLRMVYVSKTK